MTKEAYQLGAAEVIVQWNDDEVQREFLSHAAEDRINEVPPYKVDEANTFAEKRVTRISIVSQNPDALLGVDTTRVAAYQAARGKALQAVMEATQSNKLRWTVVAASSPAWAEKVFLNLLQVQNKLIDFGKKFSKQLASIQTIRSRLGKSMTQRCENKQNV